ncbi:hypothetical protein AXF42_Ash011999 [Apostasia shenzhenica]|uniref:Uncharacterized protein n=1 Tax=Apostasia shenzhenica TaxID=1088818 RepID=A0A2I0AJI5_9ASPA|nr:hypothetical protein AXF42_Ash011999 [Apostasia shenzhenica]
MVGEPQRQAEVVGGNTGISGLVVKNNATIRAFLSGAAAENERLSRDLRDLSSDLVARDSVPYRSIRAIWSALPAGVRPSVISLFFGIDFVFSSPKPREKSEELKARLMKLAEMMERKEYEELVKDVAPRREKPEPFSSFKDQIGFGLHVVLIMFTGYLVGFASFRALFHQSAVMNAAGGILGMVCGMLLETVLFIIRASSYDKLSSHSTLKKMKLQ